MSVFNNIQNALNVKLTSVIGLPDIYWQNTIKEPEQGTAWVRPTLLPADSSMYTLNDVNMHQGLYQVDIFTELKKGSAEVLLYADDIREAYNRQSLSSSGTIVFIQEISLSAPRRVEAWWNCYVSIKYLCFE